MQTTCDLSDAEAERALVLPAGLRLYGGRRHFWGRAETVRCFEDNSRVRELAGSPGEGRVMVVDAAGSLRRAVMGDVTAALAAENGWAGAVIWGAVRDTEALAGLDFGVSALGAIPLRPEPRGEGQRGLPVRLGGVLVRPGDLVVADADGVVVVPEA